MARAQTPDAKTIVDRATAAFAALKQYQLTVFLSGQTAMKLTVERPDKFRTEMDNAANLLGSQSQDGPAGKILIVGSGKTVSMYAPELNRWGRVTSKASQEAADWISNPATWVTEWEKGIVGNALLGLTGNKPAKPVNEETIQIGGQNRACYVLDYPDGRIWIDNDNYLVSRVAGGGESLQLLFEHIDTPFTDGTFSFTPPPGTVEQEMNIVRNPFH